MRIKNARELRQYLIDGDGRLRRDNWDLFESKCQETKVALSQFSILDLAKAFMGEAILRGRQPISAGSRTMFESSRSFMEADGGLSVNTTVFPQIVGQLLFSEVRRQFEIEANVFTPLIPVIPSIIKGTEIVPSIVNLAPSDMSTVNEGEAYPVVGVTEEFFTLPAKDKRGGIIQLTRESMLFDKTGTLVQQAQGIGTALGAARENANIDAFIGAAGSNNYNRNGTAAQTYTLAGVINNQSGLPLTDWTDVDAGLQLLVDILDPNTGEPRAGAMNPKHIVVLPLKLHTARRILSATQVRFSTNTNAVAATPNDEDNALSPNPLDALGLMLVSSNRLKRRVLDGPEPVEATANQTWWLGNIDKLLAWYEVWPLSVVQRGPDSAAGFHRDVDLQFKASYFGVAAVREKREMARFEDVAW